LKTELEVVQHRVDGGQGRCPLNLSARGLRLASFFGFP
jgi:hypothetical protein